MTRDMLGTLLNTSISIALLWILIQWCVRRYRVDYFRAKVFMLRAELFDHADRGDLSFHHPAYTQLRTTMNGFLRLAERIGGVALLLTAKHIPAEDVRRYEEDWQAALLTLDPGLAAELNALRARMHFEVFKQMLFASPLLVVTLVPLLFLFIVRLAGEQLVTGMAHRCYRWIERTFEGFAEPLDGAAYTVGA